MAGSNSLLDDDNYVTISESPVVVTTTTPRYDDYLRVHEDIGEFSYVVLGCVGLVFCILGVLCNVMCIPIFFTHNVRSPATTYMFAIAVFDTMTLLCGASVLVTSAMWPKQIDQVQVYKSVTGYLVPYVQPTMEFTEMMSVYLSAALLIERYKYIKHGVYVRVICTQVLTKQIIGILFALCFAYNVPKLLEFQAETVTVTLKSAKYDTPGSNATSTNTQVRVLRTDLGNSTNFREIYENLLRVPVEMFLPLIVVILFGALIAHSVFSSGMHTNSLSAPPGEKGEFDSDFEREKQKRSSMGLPTVSSAPGALASNGYKQREAVTPSAVSTGIEITEWREQMNTVVSSGVALLVICYKFPEFTQHMLVSERIRFGIAVPTLLRFGAVVNLLGLANAAFKPVVYMVCGAHLREAAKTLFCLCCSRISKPFGNQSRESSSVAINPMMQGNEESVPMITLTPESSTPTQPIAGTTLFVDETGPVGVSPTRVI